MKRSIKIILSWLLVLAIPISTIGLSANIVLRMPDIYQYQINKGELLAEYRANSQSEALADQISKYMQHRASELQYQTDEEDDMSLVFTRTDQIKFEKIRAFIDILAIFTLQNILIIVLAYVLLINDGHLTVVRIRFKVAVFVYIALFIGGMLMAFWPTLKSKMLNIIFVGIDEADFIYGLYEMGTYSFAVLATLAISTLSMAILAYFTWSKTKERGIFW